MSIGRNLGKWILSLGLLAVLLPSAGCPKGRGHGYGGCGGCDDGSFSVTSFSLDAIGWLGSGWTSSDEYYYEDVSYVDDGGYYDSYGYDESYDEYYYSDDGGKVKKAGRKK